MKLGLRRAAIGAATLLLVFGVVGTLQAQEGPAAERIQDAHPGHSDVTRFFTPASGALFAQSSRNVESPTSETLRRSDDGGTTWRDVELPPPSTDPEQRRAVSVDPLDHTILYASGQDGLYKSEDDAASWRLIFATSDRVYGPSIDPADPRRLDVRLETRRQPEVRPTSRHIRSSDGGETWEDVVLQSCDEAINAPDMDDVTYVRAALRCKPAPPMVLANPPQDGTIPSAVVDGSAGIGMGPVYAAFHEHSIEAGIPLYRTYDRGVTWETLIVGAREERPPPSPKWQGGKRYASINRLEVAEAGRLYVGLRGSQAPLRTSADGGETWTVLALVPGGQSSRSMETDAMKLGVDRRNLYVAISSIGYADPSTGVYRVRLGAP